MSTTSGRTPLRDDDRLLPVAGLPDDPYVSLGLEDHPESTSHQRLVVRQDDRDRHTAPPAYGNVACTMKPPCGVTPARRWPPCRPTRSRIPISP